jgi:hypothetical protein
MASSFRFRAASDAEEFALPRHQVQCCDDSFGATSGWDATSGLGSPKFDQLLKLAVEAGKKRLKGAAVLASSRTAARGSLQPNDS